MGFFLSGITVLNFLHFLFLLCFEYWAIALARMWAVLEIAIISLVSLALQLGLIAIVIFIVIGIFGVLLFGFRQVF